MDELQEKLLPFIKEHGIALALGVVGLVCLGYGLITFSQSPSDDSTAISSDKSDFVSITPQPPVTATPKQITIDIEGAVQKPGVYKLLATSRVQDALIAAGGMSQSADRGQIAKSLNLAAPLMDGAKLYIPAVGEQMMTSGSDASNPAGVQGASAETVNINNASEEDLDALPGVGPVTAQKIMSNRPYQSVDELVDKKIVGQSVYGKIKDLVSVY
jgi:competence protein ComEA